MRDNDLKPGDVVVYEPRDSKGQCAPEYTGSLGVITNEPNYAGMSANTCQEHEAHVRWVVCTATRNPKHGMVCRHYTFNLRRIGHVPV